MISMWIINILITIIFLEIIYFYLVKRDTLKYDYGDLKDNKILASTISILYYCLTGMLTMVFITFDNFGNPILTDFAKRHFYLMIGVLLIGSCGYYIFKLFIKANMWLGKKIENNYKTQKESKKDITCKHRRKKNTNKCLYCGCRMKK